MAFLVAVLAFLLASFPARNSDCFLHLARGRLVAEGRFAAATASDPASGLQDNQTWLYDLLCYGCYRLVGTFGLVFCKALLAAGIGLLLWYSSRSAQGWSVPTFCTSLALLAMSLYLQLQPATVSYFLLALTLALLRPQRESATAGSAARNPVWPLLLLFVLWANMDRGFVLGLVIVALVWLGEVLDRAFATDVSRGRWQSTLLRRAGSFALLAAICLLNPSQFHAFTQPISVKGIYSPFAGDYFFQVGGTPAGLAYYLLLGLSLLSFFAVLPHWNARDFLPWLGLAILSGLQVYTIPFFAVAAGPMLAVNVQQRLARRFDCKRPAPHGQRGRRFGQAVTVGAMIVLLVCAWPGWLQLPPFGPRQWEIDVSPSLERGAAAVRSWRQEGKLAPEVGGLHLSSDTVSAFRWFCPEERCLRLTPELSSQEWRRRMRAEAIQYLLIYNADRNNLLSALGGLLADSQQWPLLYQEGELAIFGWRDPERGESANLYRTWQPNANRLAYHPDENKKAPAEAPDREAKAPHWWDAFWKPSSSASLDREEAMFHLLQAEAFQRVAPLRHLNRWESSQIAGLAAAAAAWTTPAVLFDAHLRLTLFQPRLPGQGTPPSPLDQMALFLQNNYTMQRDDAPPALYYLALRAARRALARNPDDAQACLWLGESYLGLLHATRERSWRAQMPKLFQLRQAQASAALARAVALQPDFARAHLRLGQLYEEMGYLDLALKHLQIHRRLVEKAGQAHGVSREEFHKQLAQLEKPLHRLAEEVAEREDVSAIGSVGGTVRERAFSAFQRGMAGQALELLLESHRAAFGIQGVQLELELLLGVGRVRDVRNWLQPELEAELGGVAYHWFLTRAQAASGDYTRAEEECAETAQALTRIPGSSEPLRVREAMTLRIGKLLLDERPGFGAPSSDLSTPFSRAEFISQIHGWANVLKQQAELNVLRGMLAFEEGEMDEAASAFRSALAVWQNKDAAASGAGLDFNGRFLAQTFLYWLNSVSRDAERSAG